MQMNTDRRVILYPQYIDAAKTVAEGRRIPKSLGCEDPYVHHMQEACIQLKVPSEIEAKHYSRDWIPKGRLRVQLKDAEGKPINPEVPDRRTLMIKVAELVLKNPGRKEQMKAKEAAAKAEAGGSSSGAGGSKPAPSKKGKKGKK